jgi:hypothetical protein
MRSRIGRTAATLACMSSSVRHAVVAMHRADRRSAIIENPAQPRIACSGDITSSRKSLIPESTDSGRP